MSSFAQFTSQLSGTVPVATGAGKYVLYHDLTDGVLKLKDNLGNLYPIAAMQGYKESVRVASTAVLPSYLRIGNTITATANGALPAQDGVTLVVGSEFLYVNGIGPLAPDNGPYVVTQVGNGGAPFILNRRGDFAASSQVQAGTIIPVGPEGTVNKNSIFILATVDPITLNGTALDFESISGAGGGGSFTRIPIDTTKTIDVDAQVLYVGELKIEGTLKLDGSIVCLSTPNDPVVVPLVSAGPYAALNNSRISVDPTFAPFTILLPPAGTPGQEVEVHNDTSSVNAVTIDGQGNTIDGQYTKTINTAYETMRLRRKSNQQWQVVS
jgi:hypothetical protein